MTDLRHGLLEAQVLASRCCLVSCTTRYVPVFDGNAVQDIGVADRKSVITL